MQDVLIFQEIHHDSFGSPGILRLGICQDSDHRRGIGRGPTRGFTRKMSPSVQGSTWGCTLDVTRYKIESQGKSPLSAGSGGPLLQLKTAYDMKGNGLCHMSAQVKYLARRWSGWYPAPWRVLVLVLNAPPKKSHPGQNHNSSLAMTVLTFPNYYK